MKRFFIIILLLVSQLILGQEDTLNTSKVWTLDDCLEYALENNITIKNASLNKVQAVVDYSKAKSSRLPNLYGTASQSFTNGNSVDPFTSAYVTEQIYSTNVSFNSSMTLFQGNQLNNQIAQNELLLNQSLFLEQEAKYNIIISIL
jgi:outer membrane protein